MHCTIGIAPLSLMVDLGWSSKYGMIEKYMMFPCLATVETSFILVYINKGIFLYTSISFVQWHQGYQQNNFGDEPMSFFFLGSQSSVGMYMTTHWAGCFDEKGMNL